MMTQSQKNTHSAKQHPSKKKYQLTPHTSIVKTGEIEHIYPTRTTRKGDKYGIWTLTNFKHSMSLFVFGKAFEAGFTLTEGTLIAIGWTPLRSSFISIVSISIVIIIIIIIIFQHPSPSNTSSNRSCTRTRNSNPALPNTHLIAAPSGCCVFHFGQ